MSASSIPSNESSPLRRTGPREVPGHWVVIGLITFGLVVSSSMYIYWSVYSRPFKSLTMALGAEFKKSMPKIEGGRNRGGPKTLRIVMQIPFDPQLETTEYEEFVNRVVALADQNLTLDDYERFHLHAVQRAPEKEAIWTSYERAVSELLRARKTSL